MKIAYISCHDYHKYSAGYDDEESQLLQFLLEKGLDIERVIWNDAAVDWLKYDVAILKSPWDYHEQIEDFNNWLNKLQLINLKLLNPVKTIQWNYDKHYLSDIAKAGLNVIPSVFLKKGSSPSIQSLFEQLQATDIIIKPCIGAGAKKIIKVNLTDAVDQQSRLSELLSHESYLAQPFMREIWNGEWSFVFFNGVYSHCALKMPGNDDYRVQHYHGGSVVAGNPEQEHIHSASTYVAQFGKGTLYARVDGVICNGDFQLMELEVIEPYLYLDAHPEGYERFYNALLQLL